MATADVIVIGGGLHGCSTALHLALLGIKTIIIEKDHVGRHASGVNAGGVRRLGRALPEIPLAEAALTGWQNINDLVDDDCGFVSPGQIKVAETEAELEALTARRETLLGLGFAHEEIIDRNQLRHLLPAIADHCIGGMVVRGDGHANPFRTVQAFKRKAVALGVRIFETTPVGGIQRRGSTWRVGAFEAPVIVNCTGAWGGQVAAMRPAVAMVLWQGRFWPPLSEAMTASSISWSHWILRHTRTRLKSAPILPLARVMLGVRKHVSSL